MMEIPAEPTVLWIFAAVLILAFGLLFLMTKGIFTLVTIARKNGFQDHDRGVLTKMQVESSKAELLLEDIRDNTNAIKDSTRQTSDDISQHRKDFAKHTDEMGKLCAARNLTEVDDGSDTA